MAEKRDFSEFQNLLREAIGPNRTQAEFAKEAGLNASFLSRLLNYPDIKRPTVETLSKIAGHAYGGITIRALMTACGYDEEKVGDAHKVERDARKGLDPQERAMKCAKDIANGISLMLAKGPYPCRGIYEFQDTLDSLYMVEDVTFDIGEVCKGKKGDPLKEEMIGIGFSFAETDFSVNGLFGLYFCQTKGGTTLITGAEYNIDALDETHHDFLWEFHNSGYECDEVETEPVYLIHCKRAPKKDVSEEDKERAIRALKSRVAGIMAVKGVSMEEAMSIALFGDPDAPKRYLSSEGIGFYTDKVPEYRIRSFFENHRETFCRSKEEEDILQEMLDGGDVDAVFDVVPGKRHLYSTDYNTGADNWETGVANIISRETNINVYPWDVREDDNELENRSCIMFDDRAPWIMNETEKNLSRETLEQILDKYARELGCEVQDCYFVQEVNRD